MGEFTKIHTIIQNYEPRIECLKTRTGSDSADPQPTFRRPVLFNKSHGFSKTIHRFRWVGNFLTQEK